MTEKKPNPSTTPEAHDPFDPASLRLGQNFAEGLGVRKELTFIPPRSKPPSQEFIRVNPDETKRIIAAILDWEADREPYLVTPAVAEKLGKHAKPRLLVLTITAAGNLLLWMLKITPDGERENPWNLTAHAAAKLAENQWINVSSNQAAQSYDTRVAEGEIPEPEWPDLTLKEILKLAFQDHFIQSIDHPIVKKLRGVL